MFFSAKESLPAILAVLAALILGLFAASRQTPAPEPPPAPGTVSEGLAFTLSADGESYTLSGIGSCTDTAIVVPALYEGKPVTAVGAQAFYKDTGLTGITLPDTVVSIGTDAFYGCTALENVTFPDGLEEIGLRAFDRCSALASVRLPSGLKQVGSWAFLNTGLRTVTIPAGLTEFHSGAFAGCPELTVMEVEEGNPRFHSAGNCIIETAAKRLYAGCAASVIPADGSVDCIGQFAFAYCPFAAFTMPDTVTVIEDEAFESCASLKEIRLSESLRRIGIAAFRNSGLESIVLPDSLIDLGGSAFMSCRKLKDVWLNSGLENIGRYAFEESGITELFIPASVRTLTMPLFPNCAALETLTVEEGNLYYRSAGNCIIEKATSTVIAGCKKSSIPADRSVSVIGANAFSYCPGLTEIVIPEGITEIGEEAFFGASDLKKITLPLSLKVVNGAAFSDTEPESVTYMGTAKQWQDLVIMGFNEALTEAPITFHDDLIV